MWNGYKTAFTILLILIVVIFFGWLLFWNNNSSYRNRGWSRTIRNFFSGNRDNDSNPILYKQKNVSANINHAASQTNTNSVNCWGLYVDKPSKNWGGGTPPSRSVYIVNNETATISQYSADHKNTLQATLVVPTVGPTGIDKNRNSSSFTVSSAASTYFVCTIGGTICALVPSVDPVNLQVVIDNSSASAVYTGIAMTSQYIYVANFHSGFIEVYDTSFLLVTQFQDADLWAAGYGPFNIKVSGKDSLVVTFALNEDDEAVNGPGYGYVDVFGQDFTFTKRLLNRGHLNAPWGLSIVNNDQLHVGNVGDGNVHVYSLKNGKYVAPIQSCETTDPIVIDGLWGIDYSNTNDDALIYFTAGPQEETLGLYGKLFTCNN